MAPARSSPKPLHRASRHAQSYRSQRCGGLSSGCLLRAWRRRLSFRELNVHRCAWTVQAMKREKSRPTSLTLLGRSETKLPAAPAEARLETFPNPTRRKYHIRFETDDFTCLCPVTGQPDFAR